MPMQGMQAGMQPRGMPMAQQGMGGMMARPTSMSMQMPMAQGGGLQQLQQQQQQQQQPGQQQKQTDPFDGLF